MTHFDAEDLNFLKGYLSQALESKFELSNERVIQILIRIIEKIS